jgi:hypothetical protein
MVRRLALLVATALFAAVAVAFLWNGPTAHHAGRTVRCDSVVIRMQTGPQPAERVRDVPIVSACERREGVYAAGALLAAVLALAFGTGVRLSRTEPLPA